MYTYNVYMVYVSCTWFVAEYRQLHTHSTKLYSVLLFSEENQFLQMHKHIIVYHKLLTSTTATKRREKESTCARLKLFHFHIDVFAWLFHVPSCILNSLSTLCKVCCNNWKEPSRNHSSWNWLFKKKRKITHNLQIKSFE